MATFEFGNDRLRCVVDTLGAELISVRFDGKERLWQNENGGWDGHAPILFPYGGNCAVMVDGELYPTQKHGFLMEQTGVFTDKKEDGVTVCFRENDETKQVYPFAFSAFITYLVVGNCLKVTYTAVNEDDKTIYAGFGSHESYALDGSAQDYEIVFEKDESFISLIAHNQDGKMTGESVDLGNGKNLVLPEDLLSATVILKPNSRTVALKKRGEDKILANVHYPDFENLLFWHPANSRMVCIEPWQNLPDDHNLPAKELCEKQGLTALKPGEKLVVRHDIEYF